MLGKKLIFLFCVISLCFVVNLFAQENITITTYYPSPYGSYNNLSVANTFTLGGSSQNQWNTDQGGSIELAGTSTIANPVSGGTPYIDFHYGTGAAQDYNIRLVNNQSGRLTLSGGDINTTDGGYMDSGACVAGTCVSDIRFKQNIMLLSGALDKILQLNPISFEFIDSDFGQGRQYGLIAQEVEKIIPEIVKTNDDGIKKVRYGLEIQMYMLEAIKELKIENDQLKQDNADLKNRVSALEKFVYAN